MNKLSALAQVGVNKFKYDSNSDEVDPQEET